MLVSMTGFGSVQEQLGGVEYAVEVRSVNNRYLKCIIKLPDSLSSTEAAMDKLIRARIKRGTVTLSVRTRLIKAEMGYQVNSAALEKYIDQLRVLETEANPAFRIDLGSMLQLPGVCEQLSLAELSGNPEENLTRLVTQALDDLVEMRIQEGKAVEADLRAYCDTIEQSLQHVIVRAPDVVKSYMERLTVRVEDLMSAGRAQIDQDILAREVAIFAERCDVAEEVSRLTGHLQQFRQTLESEETAGRKLDFVTQEMLREANTIASKGNDTDIARSVVDMKTAIDRIKEQVQNVE